jgi:ATP-dependent DNA helicase RecQ
LTTIAPPPASVAAFSPLPLLDNEAIDQLPPPLLLRYAGWLRVSGQFDAAEAALARALDLRGESASLMDERAALALARGDAQEVRRSWEERLSRNPAPSARASYGRALLELGEVAEASDIADALLEEHSNLATVHALYAEVALQQGDIATAHAFWAGQLTQDPARITPQLSLGRIALLGGDPDEARAALQRALTDLPTLTPAQVASAATLADMLGQTGRSQMLRHRLVAMEAQRSAHLAAEIADALGLENIPATPGPPVDHGTQANGHERSAPAANVAHRPAAPETSHSQPQPGEVLDAEAAADDAATITTVPLDQEIADPQVLETLQRVFGFQGLRSGQAAVINQVLAGRDTLAILPTGAGKSLTFQLPSLLLPHMTLVLSPLIALMKDQVEGLPSALRERTVLLNSSLAPEIQRTALSDIASGRPALVYAAPERLRQPAFLRALRQGGVSLVVVDEAHCISLWGHDFRPDYLSIPASLPELGNPPVLGMTATASAETAASIQKAFRRDLDVVRTSPFRPNLTYSTERLTRKEEKARRVVELCRELPGTGIVYVSSRRDADNLAGVLRDNGVSAVAYHAGLERGLRERNQDQFMRGAARVVVATVAFGMGVDKPDVRFIIHLSPSTSLESYAQESGRAGRDGQPSRCILLYTSSDRGNQTKLANRDAMTLPQLRQVFAGIRENAGGAWAIFDPSRIVVTGDIDDDPDERPDPRIGIGLLEQGGLLERHANAPVTWSLRRTSDSEGTAPDNPEDAETWQRFTTWAPLPTQLGEEFSVDTAVACSTLGISPETLALMLDAQPGWEATPGHRLPCLRLLPIEANTASKLQRVIDDAARRARRRVDQMMAYAEGRTCRHAVLAAYLGERLPPCGDACDVCLGETQRAKPSRESRPTRRNIATQQDIDTILRAMGNLPFPLGKTGLTRLLEGSVQSRIQADRSPFFGALADLQKSKIDGAIDDLVANGTLAYDRSREFPVLRITERGAVRLQDMAPED